MRSRESVTNCSLLVHASPMASWMPAPCSSDLQAENSEADSTLTKVDSDPPLS